MSTRLCAEVALLASCGVTPTPEALTVTTRNGAVWVPTVSVSVVLEALTGEEVRRTVTRSPLFTVPAVAV